MARRADMMQFAVIGLGSFGISLAKGLHNEGAEVLCLDKDKDLIDEISDYCTQAICADASDEAVLKSLGLKNFDAVIISIGDIEANIFVTLQCKQMETEYIIVKAQNVMHRTVLEKIGADMVVLPEEIVGQKIAMMLTQRTSHEIAELSDDFSIVEIKTPPKWAGKNLVQLDLRKKYKISILIVKRADGDVVITPPADCVLQKGEELIICGSNDAIEKIKKYATVELDNIEDLLNS